MSERHEELPTPPVLSAAVMQSKAACTLQGHEALRGAAQGPEAASQLQPMHLLLAWPPSLLPARQLRLLAFLKEGCSAAMQLF